jgi:excisionase family DNA binding protein
MTPLLTVAQAAEFLAVSKPTIYRLVRDQGLPVVRITADMRFRPEDVEAWLETKTVGASP